MAFSEIVLDLFDRRHLNFDIKPAPESVTLREDWLAQTVPLDHVAGISLLQQDHTMVMAIYPMTHQPNLQELRAILGAELRFTDTEKVVSQLQALIAQPRFQPSAANGLQIIIDEALTNLEEIYFEAPRPFTVLKLKTDQLGTLADDVLLGSCFSSLRADTATKSASKETAAIDLRQRITKLQRLPAMPDMPAKILALRNNPNGTLDDLITIIEKDLSLTAQILRYANSPLFRHHSPAISLRDAIFRVLGYETVLHLSLGYALGRQFKLPAKGPLGNTTVWQHATHAAALAQQLAQAIPKANRPKPGLAYLAGLLHDVGFLVLHLFFRNEYEWLNMMLINHPNQSILDIEKRLLGISHMELGAWLLKAWQIPAELICAVEHHHHLDYQGEHAQYAHLINLTERLLKMHGMSDAESDDIPDELLLKLGLKEEEVYLITDKVLQGGPALREMARAVIG